MQLVDSHCHLNYLDDPRLALANARERGIDTILCIGVEEARYPEVLEFGRHSGEPNVWCSVGEHPGSATGKPDWIHQYLAEPEVIAVGETGLDYYYEKDAGVQALQRDGFEYQMQVASDTGLPVIIHTRDAIDDTLAVLNNFPSVRGVLHCFTESWAMAEEAISLGYYVSISGIVTFKNATNVQDVARQIPDERLLIETDAPWLAPVPNRGKQNEPGFVADTAAFLADLRDQSLEELVACTRANFFELMNLTDV